MKYPIQMTYWMVIITVPLALCHTTGSHRGTLGTDATSQPPTIPDSWLWPDVLPLGHHGPHHCLEQGHWGKYVHLFLCPSVYLWRLINSKRRLHQKIFSSMHFREHTIYFLYFFLSRFSVFFLRSFAIGFLKKFPFSKSSTCIWTLISYKLFTS